MVSIETKEIKTLVLSGGGSNGILHLGAICFLNKRDNNFLKNIKTYYGTSVGSMISYLLIIGYTPIGILRYLINNPLSDVVPNLRGLLLNDKMGGYNWEIIDKHLRDLTLKKIGFIPSLGYLLSKFGKKLVCVTFNQSKNITEYMSPDNHSELSVLIAIRMSCSIPFVFEKFKYFGDVYIDGGISDSYPIQKAIEEKEESICGLKIVNSSSIVKEPENILQYLFWVINTPIKLLNDEKDVSKEKTIYLKTDPQLIPDFSSNTKKMELLFKDGYYQCGTSFGNLESSDTLI